MAIFASASACAGVHCRQGLGCVLFELAERIEVGLLLLERRQGCLGTADDLAQPAALLFFGVRDVVVQLLLQLERLGHVGLGFLQRLGEVADGGLAVLRLGEAEFLLARLDGVVGFDEQRAALLAQVLDAQRSQRIELGALRAVAGAGGDWRPSSAGCGGRGTRLHRRLPRRRYQRGPPCLRRRRRERFRFRRRRRRRWRLLCRWRPGRSPSCRQRGCRDRVLRDVVPLGMVMLLFELGLRSSTCLRRWRSPGAHRPSPMPLLLRPRLAPMPRGPWGFRTSSR